MSLSASTNPARHYPSRSSRPALGFVAMAIAVAVAAAGGMVVVRGVVTGTGGWHLGHLVALVGGALVCGGGLCLLQSGLRRRSRLRAIGELMPRYREHVRRVNEAGGVARLRKLAGADDWEMDAPEWSDEGSELPRARAEMRAATRALLVSLADEIRQEASRRGRDARPACRHARLRAAGRGSVERRRRVVARPGRTLS